MGRMIFALVLTSALTFGIAGCRDKGPDDTAEPQDARTAAGDHVREGVAAAEERLKVLEADWQEIRGKIAATGEEVKDDLEKVGEEIQRQVTAARDKLQEAGRVGEERWNEEVKPALESAFEGMRRLIADTAEKLAPGNNDGDNDNE